MNFTAIRNGNLGATYEQLSEAIIDDEENSFAVIEPSKLYALREQMEASKDWSYAPTAAEVNAAHEQIRRFEYARKSDPIALKMLRNEATREDWDVARAEIMAKWPDVPEV